MLHFIRSNVNCYFLKGLAAVPGWETRGSAEVHDSFIRLTPEETRRNGIIINKRPFFLKTVELTLEFSVHSSTANPVGNGGMALWMIDQPLRIGPIFGGPGMVTYIYCIYQQVTN